MQGQRLPPPHSSSRKFRVMMLPFAPHCETELGGDAHPHVLLNLHQGRCSWVVTYLWLEWSKS